MKYKVIYGGNYVTEAVSVDQVQEEFARDIDQYAVRIIAVEELSEIARAPQTTAAVASEEASAPAEGTAPADTTNNDGPKTAEVDGAEVTAQPEAPAETTLQSDTLVASQN